ncbi:MAG: holo-ACP synthase [Chloroflexi bacterium]|nr:holo-ACP synthase [Chloroflexota bacterium]
MRSLATGIDLVEIDRFRNLDPGIRERFYKRVFTPSELVLSPGSENHLAGKFAAKEAASKALGCGIGEVHWQDLEILNEESGRPVLVLHNKAIEMARLSNWSQWSLSISHTKNHAIAVVTALIESED